MPKHSFLFFSAKLRLTHIYKTILVLLLFSALLLSGKFIAINITAWTGYTKKSEIKQQVHFINTRQGDAILIRTANKTVLIDAATAESDVSSYLRSQGVDTIHVLMATHAHSDHIGGMSEIIDQFVVLEFVDPAFPHTGSTYGKLLGRIDDLDIQYTVGQKGLVWELDRNAILEVIHPICIEGLSVHDAGLVSRLRLGRITFLLAADIERKAENILLEKPRMLRSHVLKVANHGRATSSTTLFLQAVRPEISVITTGSEAPDISPHPHTLAKLRATNTKIYENRTYGHIIIETDGKDFEVIIHGKVHVMPVNLNAASLEELMRIVHIGQGRAEQIINLRPLEAIDDLLQIDGIGPRRLEDIKKQNKAMID